MRLTVQPYVWNAPSIDQISVCILIPHLISIKMQIPIRKHLLTRKPHNRHDPLHVYRQPNGDSRAIGQRSYAVCPRSECAAATQLSGASINRATVWSALPRGFAPGSYRPPFKGRGYQKALRHFWKRCLRKVASYCPTSKQLLTGMINGRKLK